jgi:hypothetical protein
MQFGEAVAAARVGSRVRFTVERIVQASDQVKERSYQDPCIDNMSAASGSYAWTGTSNT